MSLFLLLLMPVFTVAQTVVVQTNSGPIVGISADYGFKKINTFYGIPFARPPVGDLRFKRTLPVEPWSSPVYAFNLPPACPQYYPFDYPWVDFTSNQNEDCLYLNIWAPVGAAGKKKAVMFWIFSGGYSYGSINLPVYDGSALALREDVIVVSVNYRLGILGFLSSDTEEAPGNAGFYDVLEGLKWVNNNIEAFGGDKSRITLFGNSAGGEISSIFFISPLTNGLFQRMIIQSGLNTDMTSDNKQTNEEMAQKVAEIVRCAPNCTEEGQTYFKTHTRDVIKCLRGRPAEDLILATNSLSPLSIVTFSSIVGDEIMPVKPNALYESGNFHDVDVMIGTNQDEGSFHLTSADVNYFGAFGEKNPRVNKSLADFFIRKINPEFIDKDSLVSFYLGVVNDDDYEAIRRQAYRTRGDMILTCPAQYFAENISRKRTLYRYYFDQRPTKTIWAYWRGVAHFDEVAFVFGRPLVEPFSYTKAEKMLSRTMMTLWANFAKFGTPSSDNTIWEPFSKETQYIMIFKTDVNYPNDLPSHTRNCEFLRKYIGF